MTITINEIKICTEKMKRKFQPRKETILLQRYPRPVFKGTELGI